MFRMTVEKYAANQAEFWTNVYWLTGTTVNDFGPEVTAVVNAEKALYPEWVKITKVRIDDATPDTDVSKAYVQNISGTRALVAGNQWAPLFVVARVDIETATGRPSRKYLRGVLFEADFDTASLTGGITALLQSYGNALVASAALVDVDGQDFTAAAPYPAPAMRQLRRGSKRKVTP
jgi:hypothetical protein